MFDAILSAVMSKIAGGGGQGGGGAPQQMAPPAPVTPPVPAQQNLAGMQQIVAGPGPQGIAPQRPPGMPAQPSLLAMLQRQQPPQRPY